MIIFTDLSNAIKKILDKISFHKHFKDNFVPWAFWKGKGPGTGWLLKPRIVVFNELQYYVNYKCDIFSKTADELKCSEKVT